MITITSLQNPHVKSAVNLRDRRHRERQGKILIDGARELGRAIAAGAAMEEVFVCRTLVQGEEAQQVLALLPGLGINVYDVTEPVFHKLAFGDRAEGVLGVARAPEMSLEHLELSPQEGQPPLVVVLEGVEKPGNVGAVLRSADAAGVSALVVADPRTDLFNPNAIRASLGAIFTVPVAAATSAETIAWLDKHHLTVYAARVDGSVPYTEADFRRGSAIVLGSEVHGLTDTWKRPDIQPIRLPMLGVADSLNVSVTAAVLCYEVLRQRAETFNHVEKGVS